VMPLMNSRIAATARINRTPLSFQAKMPARQGLKIFFAKQWRVYRISAHCLGSTCNLNHLLI
jgi:hypothetical protein